MQRLLVLTVCAILSLTLSYAEADSISVQDVVVSGNKKTDETALGLQIDAKAGSVLRTTVDKDVKALFGTGFFDQVQAVITKDSKGRSILEYQVTEKPIVRKVFVQGNEDVDKEDIEVALDFKAGRFFDVTQANRASDRIVSSYQGRGYYDSEVTYALVPAASNQVDVTFTVVEGSKYKIKEVSFTGLKVLDDGDLRSVIQTKTYKWWSSWLLGTGRLNKEMLDNDRNIMRQELFNNGLIEGSISEPVISKKNKGIYISFHVNEGEQYKIGAIQASGDLIDDDQTKTLAELKSKTGKVFSGSVLRSDALTVSDKFSDIGYAFANVVPDTQINKQLLTVDVNFKISKGKLITVDRIQTRGNNKTYDNVIRRDVVIAEQDIYSSSKIKRSQELLQRRGYFDEVNIVTENTTKDDAVNLAVNVKEGSTGTVSVGAGFSSSDGVLFNTRLSENNFMGTGRKANLEVDIGNRRDNMVVSFSDPRVFDSQWSLGIDLLRTERNYDDYDQTQLGGGITAGYDMAELFGSWAKDMRFSTRYQLVDVEIDNVSPDAAELVKSEVGKSLVSSLTPSLVRNTINNPLDPSNGSRQTLSVKYAGLGGDEEFYLIEAINQIYHPLVKFTASELVFSLRTRIGYGETFNDDTLPLFERFFPGGINSVRGFKNRTLGPKDSNGREFGGTKQLVNNIELIFPIAPSAGLKGVIFHDIGEAFDDNQSIDFGELRQAVGYGIRWTSPLGPIRIEFGYPIDKEEGESSFVTQFSFGAPF